MTETKEITLPIENNDKHAMVLFTDGSARPNPGNRGFGMHGYLYSRELPKRGSGHTTHYPTAKGYVPKINKTTENAPAEVQVLEYIDLYDSCITTGSNNLSEVQAVSKGIEKALDFDIDELTIFTDSEYARKGIYDWSHSWISNDWVKQDGTEVSNKEAWQALLFFKLKLEQKGVKLSVQWVKGHKDNYGNIMADKLAEIGVMNSIYGTYKEVYERTPPVGYWKSEVEKHPFIYDKRMYFNTDKAHNVPGLYYLGTHGMDDTLIGSQRSGTSYSVVRLKEKQIVMEDIRDIVISLAQGRNEIMMLRLDHLHNPTIYKELSKFGKAAVLRRNENKLDLSTLDEEPLAVEIKPPRLAFRAIEALSNLQVVLDEIVVGTSPCALVDITNNFFTEINGKLKLVTELAKTGVTTLMTAIPHKGKNLPLKLALGKDCPDRNTFKKLEDTKTKVKLVLNYESDYVLRYAIYIESEENHGIWTAWDTNILFVEP